MGLLLWGMWQGAMKGDDKPPAETKVPRIKKAPTIDGVLEEAAWRRAPSLTLRDIKGRQRPRHDGEVALGRQKPLHRL
jgi:hypothetical protein